MSRSTCMFGELSNYSIFYFDDRFFKKLNNGEDAININGLEIIQFSDTTEVGLLSLAEKAGLYNALASLNVGNIKQVAEHAMSLSPTLERGIAYQDKQEVLNYGQCI